MPCEEDGKADIVMVEVGPKPKELTDAQRKLVEREWAGPKEVLSGLQ